MASDNIFSDSYCRLNGWYRSGYWPRCLYELDLTSKEPTQKVSLSFKEQHQGALSPVRRKCASFWASELWAHSAKLLFSRVGEFFIWKIGCRINVLLYKGATVWKSAMRGRWNYNRVGAVSFTTWLSICGILTKYGACWRCFPWHHFDNANESSALNLNWMEGLA